MDIVERAKTLVELLNNIDTGKDLLSDDKKANLISVLKAGIYIIEVEKDKYWLPKLKKAVEEAERFLRRWK